MMLFYFFSYISLNFNVISIVKITEEKQKKYIILINNFQTIYEMWKDIYIINITNIYI